MQEEIWILRRPVNGRVGEERFENKRGLLSVLKPIAWRGLEGFEVIGPGCQALTGAVLKEWVEVEK
jgi:hypothetical protein